MSPRPDPDEKVSLFPMEGEEVLKRLLGAEEGEEGEEVSEDPGEGEADS